MIKRIRDSRLTVWAAELKAYEDELSEFITETTPDYPDASLQLTEVVRLLVTARTALTDATETVAPLCKCGHRLNDHLGMGRCDEGTKRCRCMVYRSE